jgi:hypothetical protein
LIFSLFGRNPSRAAARFSETVALYRELRTAHEESGYGAADVIDRLSDAIAAEVGKEVELPACASLAQALDRFQREIFALETAMFTFPEIDWNSARLGSDELDHLNQFLQAKKRFLDNDDWILERMGGCLLAVIEGLLRALPPLEDSDTNGRSVPLVTVLPAPGTIIDKIIGTFTKDEFVELGVFSTLQQQLYANVCRASGLTPETRGNKSLVTADRSALAPIDLVNAYLRETPLFDLFVVRVPHDPTTAPSS